MQPLYSHITAYKASTRKYDTESSYKLTARVYRPTHNGIKQLATVQDENTQNSTHRTYTCTDLLPHACHVYTCILQFNIKNITADTGQGCIMAMEVQVFKGFFYS